MERTLIYKNHKGDMITFTYKPPFLLSICDGFHETVGTVNSVSSAYGVGTTWNGTSIGQRDLTIKGTITDNIQENRLLLYDMFPLNSEGTLYYYEGDIERKITCLVEKVSIPEKKGFTRDFSISLVCPNPRFSALAATILSMATWTPAFKFKLVIPKNKGIKFGTKNTTSMGTTENTTEIDYGMTIKFKANDTVKNPYLFNVTTRDIIQIEKTMSAGDQIIITTHIDNKNVIYKNAVTGEEENINYLIMYGSKYLQVPSGTNTFRSGADSGEDNLETTIEFLPEYEAV
ncbi:MAG: phage tail family protein [Bacilli bacterium]|jgi:hypothetical protein|uniref:Tail protein n=1 Tax=Siphoviridae sp. ctCVD13 TaxID=2826194 RepID=A0A8S5MFD7_9CAUD|nr:phage tail family protein [Clostridia bacterium]MEE0015453.1 phage tail family protein [Bacilli bacterium]DAD81049.1 MAG TPA: tail protein [Siphoviridae sp. ctCVD13]